MLENNGPVKREAAIYGWFGSPVNVTDGKYPYMRAAVREDNNPRFAHYQIPRSSNTHKPIFFQDVEVGRFLPWTDLPVFRCRWTGERNGGNRWTHKRWETFKETLLFNIETDPGQENNLAGAEIEKAYIERLKKTMKKHDAPPSQFERLGLSLQSGCSLVIKRCCQEEPLKENLCLTF